MKIKAKIKNCDLIKMKSFCIAKETINKVKTAHTRGGPFCKWWDWQGVNLQNTQTLHTAQYLNNKQHNQKVAEDLNRHFSKEGIQMAKRHMKICSTTLIIKEIQIKTTMRHHFTPVRMAIIKKSVNNKCWRCCGGKGTFLHH